MSHSGCTQRSPSLSTQAASAAAAAAHAALPSLSDDPPLSLCQVTTPLITATLAVRKPLVKTPQALVQRHSRHVTRPAPMQPTCATATQPSARPAAAQGHDGLRLLGAPRLCHPKQQLGLDVPAGPLGVDLSDCSLHRLDARPVGSNGLTGPRVVHSVEHVSSFSLSSPGLPVLPVLPVLVILYLSIYLSIYISSESRASENQDKDVSCRVFFFSPQSFFSLASFPAFTPRVRPSHSHIRLNTLKERSRPGKHTRPGSARTRPHAFRRDLVGLSLSERVG